jgi:hypothetical protein
MLEPPEASLRLPTPARPDRPGMRMPDSEATEPVQDRVNRALDAVLRSRRPAFSGGKHQDRLAGTKSALRPSLDFFGYAQNNGLSGSINSLPVPPFRASPLHGDAARPSSVDPYFIGGYGRCSQIFRRNFRLRRRYPTNIRSATGRLRRT